MIAIGNGENIEFSGIFVTNSPAFHITPNVKNLYMHDFEIYVDMVGIMDIWKLFAYKHGKEYDNVNGIGIELPTFPLNTDGIDFSGKNATFRNIKITNFDDAIVVKPSNNDSSISPCTEDVLVENCTVVFGVGMSIGSVAPKAHHSCVRNVIFRDTVFHHPFKAVYIKTNPRHYPVIQESGEITNILYENLRIHNPIWWGIYIGPQ